jgi:hypothetical protein
MSLTLKHSHMILDNLKNGVISTLAVIPTIPNHPNWSIVLWITTFVAGKLIDTAVKIYLNKRKRNKDE